MTEDYLHYIWKYKLFSQQNLVTTEGEPLEILSFGFHNHDSGPDFSQAKIKIEETLWAGNIEIHIRASHWNQHNHQFDTAYDSVVLHVVWECDTEITTTKGGKIPTLELKNRIDLSQFEDYQRFIFSSIPCINSLQSVPNIIVASAMDQMLSERLLEKSEVIKQELENGQSNWEQVFFQFVAKAMGMKVNSLAMEQLAKQIDVKFFSKFGDNLKATESYLFGQAGFLEDLPFDHEYGNQIKKEYSFLKAKYELIPMNKVMWKFSKLRPSNFPTLRLAQLARLVNENKNLFHSLILEKNTIQEMRKKLTVSIHSGFWHTHYTFEKESKSKSKSIGESLIDSIVINTIAPFLYCYGTYKDEQEYKERAIELMKGVAAENNKITRLFEGELTIKSAAESQALIQCHNNYCVNKKCLDCSIGVYLLKK